MAKYKLPDFHMSRTRLKLPLNSKPKLKPLKSMKLNKILILEAEITKFWSPNAQNMPSCSITHTISTNIKEHVFFPTDIANNLESESQAGLFFLCMLFPVLEAFQSNFSPYPHLCNVKIFKICPDTSSVLELSMNLHNLNSWELQQSSCAHQLPVVLVFLQYKWIKRNQTFLVWNIYHWLE